MAHCLILLQTCINHKLIRVSFPSCNVMYYYFDDHTKCVVIYEPSETSEPLSVRAKSVVRAMFSFSLDPVEGAVQFPGAEIDAACDISM